jgi:hypothetical protein
VQGLRARWKEFMQVIANRCGRNVQAYLRSVRDVAIGGNQVTFAFGNNDFVREMMSKPETLTQVAGVLSEFLGSPVTLECQSGERARLAAAVHIAATGEPHRDGPDPLLEFAVSELNAELEKGG